MADRAGDMATFRAAMDQIYGPFENSDNLDAIGNWQPPALSPKSSRYLWTDAFGVVNFITLSRLSTSGAEGELWTLYAKRLIQSVHDTLGKSRDGSRRLRGATDEQPLSGGLRIGKDEESGPDQDGQYHHYLTWGDIHDSLTEAICRLTDNASSLWMFALNRYYMHTKDKTYNDLAIQLAKAIHPYFVTKDTDDDRPKS